MKKRIWSPDRQRDSKVNKYLDEMNRAPYFTIGAVLIGLFCLFTVIVLMSVY